MFLIPMPMRAVARFAMSEVFTASIIGVVGVGLGAYVIRGDYLYRQQVKELEDKIYWMRQEIRYMVEGGASPLGHVNLELPPESLEMGCRAQAQRRERLKEIRQEEREKVLSDVEAKHERVFIARQQMEEKARFERKQRKKELFASRHRVTPEAFKINIPPATVFSASTRPPTEAEKETAKERLRLLIKKEKEDWKEMEEKEEK